MEMHINVHCESKHLSLYRKCAPESIRNGDDYDDITPQVSIVIIQI